MVEALRLLEPYGSYYKATSLKLCLSMFHCFCPPQWGKWLKIFAPHAWRRVIDKKYPGCWIVSKKSTTTTTVKMKKNSLLTSIQNLHQILELIFEGIFKTSKYIRKEPVLRVFKPWVVLLNKLRINSVDNPILRKNIEGFYILCWISKGFFPFMVGVVDFFGVLCCWRGAIFGCSGRFCWRGVGELGFMAVLMKLDSEKVVVEYWCLICDVGNRSILF